VVRTPIPVGSIAPVAQNLELINASRNVNNISATTKGAPEAQETAKATPQKVTKGKTANASAHKGTAKHKTASESEEEGGSKGESKSKVKSKTVEASKDTDESETPKKKTSSFQGRQRKERRWVKEHKDL